MKNKSFCGYCGQSMIVYKHSIARRLALILLRVKNYTAPFHLQKDAHMSYSENCNFYKLPYWGVVSPDDFGSGYYHITDKGRDFLDGKIEINKWIKTFDNRIVEKSDEMVSIDYCKQYWNQTYKKRDEYLSEGEDL